MNALNRTLLLLLVMALTALSACDNAKTAGDPAPSAASAGADKKAAEKLDEEEKDDDDDDDEHDHDDEHAKKAKDHDHSHVEGEHGHDHDNYAVKTPESADDLPDGINVVGHEMLLLNNAMIGVFSLIIANQLENIPATIYSVHDARDLTERTLAAGKYKTPKNSDDLDGFMKLDEAFHDDLVELVKAAQKDDLKLTTEKYADVIQGCTDCHTQYRY